MIQFFSFHSLDPDFTWFRGITTQNMENRKHSMNQKKITQIIRWLFSSIAFQAKRFVPFHLYWIPTHTLVRNTWNLFWDPFLESLSQTNFLLNVQLHILNTQSENENRTFDYANVKQRFNQTKWCMKRCNKNAWIIICNGSYAYRISLALNKSVLLFMKHNTKWDFFILFFLRAQIEEILCIFWCSIFKPVNGIQIHLGHFFLLLFQFFFQ